VQQQLLERRRRKRVRWPPVVLLEPSFRRGVSGCQATAKAGLESPCAIAINGLHQSNDCTDVDSGMNGSSQSCATLLACCDTPGYPQKSACLTVVNAGAEASCQSLLASQAILCPGVAADAGVQTGGGGDTCVIDALGAKIVYCVPSPAAPDGICTAVESPNDKDCSSGAAGTCPSSDLVGCCTSVNNNQNQVVCYYSPNFTAAQMEPQCTGLCGTWTTTF
jgi:hypothetical protein